MWLLKKYIRSTHAALAFEILDDKCVDEDGSSIYIRTYVVEALWWPLSMTHSFAMN